MPEGDARDVPTVADVARRLHQVAAPEATTQTLVEVDARIDDAIDATRLAPCTGDELHAVVVNIIGYGMADPVFKRVMHRLQKHLRMN